MEPKDETSKKPMKLVKDEEEIRYTEIYERPVTPSEGGVHIAFPKKFRGRVVRVVIPKEKEYVWLFGTKEVDLLKKGVDEMEVHSIGAGYLKAGLKTGVFCLLDKKFSEDTLNDICLLKYHTENKEILDLINKIEKTYRWKGYE